MTNAANLSPLDDPVTLGVLWHRMVAICDEMAGFVVRTAFSTVVRESNDFACVLLDRHGNLLAQYSQSIPSITGTMSVTCRALLEQVDVGEERDPEPVLVAKLAVPLDGVPRDADDDASRLLDLRAKGREGLRLARAAGGVVLGVEVDDQVLAGEVPQTDLLAGVAVEREIGDAGTFGEHRRSSWGRGADPGVSGDGVGPRSLARRSRPTTP